MGVCAGVCACTFLLAHDTAQLLIFIEANIAWLQMVSPRTDVACIDGFRYGANVILSCRTGILFCTECGGLKIVRARCGSCDSIARDFMQSKHSDSLDIFGFREHTQDSTITVCSRVSGKIFVRNCNFLLITCSAVKSICCARLCRALVIRIAIAENESRYAGQLEASHFQLCSLRCQ